MFYKLSILLTVAVLAILSIVLACSGLPMYDGDAIWFMPVSINECSGYGFRNDWFPDADPRGEGRMVWHGFLSNLIIGRLMWNATYPVLFVVQALIAAAILAITGFLFLRLVPPPGRLNVISASLGGIFFLAGLLPPLFSGRPEPFTTLILVLVVAVLSCLPRRWHSLGMGLGLALLAVTQPTVAVLAIPACGVYLACVFPWRKVLLEFAAMGMIALLTSVVIASIFHPFGFVDWIDGLRHHGSRTQVYWSESMIGYWFLTPDRFGYGFWYLAAAVYLTFRYVRGRADWGSPTLVMLFAAVGLIAAWRFGVQVSATNYNLIAFAPLVCLVLLEALLRYCRTPAISQPLRLVGMTMILMVAAVPSIGTARFLLHPVASQQHGLSYWDARQYVDSLLEHHPTLAITSGLFTLADDQRRLELLGHQGGQPMSLPRCQVFLMQQANTGHKSPVAIDGFVLVEHRFSEQRPMLFGIPTGNTPAGYNFALYVQEDSQAKELGEGL